MDEETSGSECARLARAGSTLRIRPRGTIACPRPDGCIFLVLVQVSSVKTLAGCSDGFATATAVMGVSVRQFETVVLIRL